MKKIESTFDIAAHNKRVQEICEEVEKKFKFNNFNQLLITKPLSELAKLPRGKNDFITVLKFPSTISSRLAQGSYDECTHKIYEGENIYYLKGVPGGFGESELMIYEK